MIIGRKLLVFCRNYFMGLLLAWPNCWGKASWSHENQHRRYYILCCQRLAGSCLTLHLMIMLEDFNFSSLKVWDQSWLPTVELIAYTTITWLQWWLLVQWLNNVKPVNYFANQKSLLVQKFQLFRKYIYNYIYICVYKTESPHNFDMKTFRALNFYIS